MATRIFFNRDNSTFYAQETGRDPIPLTPTPFSIAVNAGATATLVAGVANKTIWLVSLAAYGFTDKSTLDIQSNATVKFRTAVLYYASASPIYYPPSEIPHTITAVGEDLRGTAGATSIVNVSGLAVIG